MPDNWRLFRCSTKTVSTAEGLGLDDALPWSVVNLGSPPILHLYNFVPSAIVGKYQDIEAALRLERCRVRGIEYNRRSTGGGTVIMGPTVLALGLGINVDYPGLKKGIGGVFESLASVLTRALEALGIRAGFRPKNDIEVGGRKIAGLSAATEEGKGLLFHTSMLADFDVELMTDIMNTPVIKLQDKGYNCFSQRMTTIREQTGRLLSMDEVMDAVQGSFEDEFGIKFMPDEPDEREREAVRSFIEKRYSNPEWVFSHKHPRSRMGVGRVKTPGGLLEVYLALSGSSIENLMITGDFFSTSQDINRLENALKWSSASDESIEANLASVWTDGMIHGIKMDSLLEAILKAKENQVRL
jgi:lipoate-protein ligase A